MAAFGLIILRQYQWQFRFFKDSRPIFKLLCISKLQETFCGFGPCINELLQEFHKKFYFYKFKQNNIFYGFLSGVHRLPENCKSLFYSSQVPSKIGAQRFSFDAATRPQLLHT